MAKDVTPHVLSATSVWLLSLAADMGISDNTIASLLDTLEDQLRRRYLHGSDKSTLLPC